jgi:type IV pilus assembly protein PilN
MIRINLLPHRELRRAERRRQFISISAGTVVLSLLAVAAGHVLLSAKIDDQRSRNQLLKDEIAVLDKQIAEINKLKERSAALLARKQVVEALQANRTEAVQLIDQLVRQLPDGVYLRQVKQSGAKVNVTGYAQSNARVSTFMRNIESSPVLVQPELVEIKAATVNSQRVSEFSLNFSMKRAADATQGVNAPAGGGKEKKA